MSKVKLAQTTDVSNGSMKTFHVQGKVVALAHVDGEYFAVDDTCSHEHCSLGTEGMLEGSTIICGCHGANFEAATGKVLSLPAPTDIASYSVTVEGSDIYIDLP